MALELLTNSGPAVSAGVWLAQWGHPGWSFTQYILSQHDPLWFLIGSTCIDFGIYDCAETLGYPGGDVSSVKLFDVGPSRLRYDGHLDWEYYGRHVSSVQALLSGIGRFSTSNFDAGREHPTTHYNVDGRLGLDSDTSLLQPRSPGVIYLPTFGDTYVLDAFSEVHRAYLDVVLSADAHPSFELGPPVPPYGYTRLANDVLKSLADAGTITFDGFNSVNHAYYSTTLSGCSLATSRGYLRFNYTQSETIPGEGTYVWDVELVARLSGWVPVSPYNISSGGRYQISSPDGFISLRREYIGTDSSVPNSWGYPLGTVLQRTWNLSDVVSPMYTSHPSPAATFDAFPVKQIRNTFEEYRARLEAYHPHMRDAHYLAAIDALDSGTGTISTNMSQTVIKLNSVGDLAGDFSKNAGQLRDIFHAQIGKPLGSATIAEVTDFVSGTYLATVFSLRPLAEFIFRWLGDAKEAIEGGIGLSGDYRWHGTFTYDVPIDPADVVYFDAIRLRLGATMKITVESDTSALLAGLRSLGFTPGLSQVWDNIPMSFVVNWFTNLGARMKDLESVALMSLFGTPISTYTYRLEASIRRTSLPTGLQLVGGLPTVVLWNRDVTKYPPTPRSGKYDFRAPRAPDLITAVSLLVQLLS